MVTFDRSGFGAALLGGLAELGPVDPFSGDLSLELGISVWLRRSGTSLMEARGTLIEVRGLIIETGGLDAATEPVPLVGRSLRVDVVNLVAYVGDLLRRASSEAGCSIGTVIDRVVAELSDREDEAIGA
jgi:hypothetical protein